MTEDIHERTIGTVENDEVGIVERPDEKYRYYLIDTDGHEFPVWPDEIDSYRELLDQFEKETE